MKNILLIGLGYHARRIYYPIIQELQEKERVNKIFIIDLLSEKNIIENYLHEKNSKKTFCYYLKKAQNKKLSKDFEEYLNNLIAREKIEGTIIATEPLAHTIYAEWALKNGISILMDKPISTHENIISRKSCANKLIKDYNKLLNLYQKSKEKNKNIVFSLMTQRRFHRLFNQARKSIKEIFEYTNSPITSIQTFHCDGQWRFPTEIIEQSAHPYNQGYGKCSHSGYHFFDLTSWLMEAAEGDKKPDHFAVSSQYTSPSDFINQINYEDYRNLFSDFDSYNNYSKNEFLKKSKKFGEIDSFNQFAFRKKERTITLASINLCHTGFSQRNWPTAANRDLYKGNGRVRQEIHIIEQGPFQSLIYFSLQSKEVDPSSNKNLSDPGGENHADLFISRNSKLNPSWKSFQKISASDLIKSNMKGKSRGHQEEARRDCVIDFINALEGKPEKIRKTSDLTHYQRTIKMMTGSYLSMIKSRKSNGLSFFKTKI